MYKLSTPINCNVAGFFPKMWQWTSVQLNRSARQGFMQDNIITSHTCFGGHMDVNC